MKKFAQLIFTQSICLLIYVMTAALGRIWDADIIKTISMVLYVCLYLLPFILMYLMYGRWLEEHSTFLLPLSFLPMPVVFYVMLAITRTFFPSVGSVEWWDMQAISYAFTYILPFFVLTIIVSFVMRFVKIKLIKNEDTDTRKEKLLMNTKMPVGNYGQPNSNTNNFGRIYRIL